MARRKLTKKQAKAFLATPQGREWLERKIAEKNAARPDPGPRPAHWVETKFPFRAIINGEVCVVWPDSIEHTGEYEGGELSEEVELGEAWERFG